ncbi:MAG: hypothetical protein A3F16_08845 [Deltaproteobacteria bacterium RIFCSPHIGHO2_12_FULL_43_9]|nr:MAG: hypothetical protein A3F16_08845 [Deltaproteobacteria bacterium RIFCSPHIGHO2_12_FULL_43_9]
MKKIIFLFIGIIFITGCGTPSRKPEGPILKPSVMLTDADFRETWFATIATVKKFPLKAVDKNSGLIETDWINYHSDLYTDTFGGDTVPEEGRFRLRIHVVEKFDAPKTRISITKYDQLSGFLPNTYMDVASNGVTEATLQYRIKRQIEMNRRLQSKGMRPLPIRVPELEGLPSTTD